MGINAMTQMLVPPPKYSVDRLVPCRIGQHHAGAGAVHHRAGRAADRRPGPRARTLERMIENTDDAYGFPPFRYLAPRSPSARTGYRHSRQREREILAGFLSHVRARVVASDNFGWADDIPRLIDHRGEAGREDPRPAPSGKRGK